MSMKQLIKRVIGMRNRDWSAAGVAYPMQGVNSYWRQLTESEIAAGKHRIFVGGLWEELGKLQLDFMKRNGLLPHHRLVDIGCGALRGGVHFVRYLDSGNYYGIDLNASLIEAGRKELDSEKLTEKMPSLLANDKFELQKFKVDFDYAISVSLFTHLHMNQIIRCLIEVGKTLKPGGKFFATFFEAPAAAHLQPATHQPGAITTFFDSDPFHYSVSEMEWMAREAALKTEVIGDWDHPRAQKMLCFFK